MQRSERAQAPGEFILAFKLSESIATNSSFYDVAGAHVPVESVFASHQLYEDTIN